ncbi:MAG: hypothetical protein JNK65_02555, partial [Deltaproteobacteria bacterium]|nr:hypothetical protein [Deltaproteobacteria bacterium]
TKNASDNWAFSTLDGGDGIGTYYNVGVRTYTFPQGQMGASASRFMKPNGGTVPQWTTQNYIYKLTMEGICWLAFTHNGDGGTDGAGAVSAQVATPYTSISVATSDFGMTGGLVNTPTYGNAVLAFVQQNSSHVMFIRNTSATTNSQVLNSDFANGIRDMNTVIAFQAF